MNRSWIDHLLGVDLPKRRKCSTDRPILVAAAFVPQTRQQIPLLPVLLHPTVWVVA